MCKVTHPHVLLLRKVIGFSFSEGYIDRNEAHGLDELADLVDAQISNIVDTAITRVKANLKDRDTILEDLDPEEQVLVLKSLNYDEITKRCDLETTMSDLVCKIDTQQKSLDKCNERLAELSYKIAAG